MSLAATRDVAHIRGLYFRTPTTKLIVWRRQGSHGSSLWYEPLRDLSWKNLLERDPTTATRTWWVHIFMWL